MNVGKTGVVRFFPDAASDSEEDSNFCDTSALLAALSLLDPRKQQNRKTQLQEVIQYTTQK